MFYLHKINIRHQTVNLYFIFSVNQFRRNPICGRGWAYRFHQPAAPCLPIRTLSFQSIPFHHQSKPVLFDYHPSPIHFHPSIHTMLISYYRYFNVVSTIQDFTITYSDHTILDHSTPTEHLLCQLENKVWWGREGQLVWHSLLRKCHCTSQLRGMENNRPSHLSFLRGHDHAIHLQYCAAWSLAVDIHLDILRFSQHYSNIILLLNLWL